MSWYERPYAGGPYRDGGFFDNPLTWAPSIGRVSGIVIRLHMLFIVYIVLQLLQAMGRAGGFWYEAQFLFVLFGSVFLHELGHCFAARAVGGDAHEVLMWPLGGLATCDGPMFPWPQFVIVVCGPLVNVALFAIAFVLLKLPALAGDHVSFNPLATWSEFAASWGNAQAWAWLFYRVNIGLFLFNLLPMYPMDGGRMFLSAAWKIAGYRKAMLITCGVGMVCAIVVGMYALLSGFWIMVGIAFMGYLECMQQRMAIRAGYSGDENETGYDFSRGYTSSEPSSRRAGWLARWKRRRADERRQREQQAAEQDQAEIDRILAKIHEQGLGSLTRGEKRALQSATERQRQREDGRFAGRR